MKKRIAFSIALLMILCLALAGCAQRDNHAGATSNEPASESHDGGIGNPEIQSPENSILTSNRLATTMVVILTMLVARILHANTILTITLLRKMANQSLSSHGQQEPSIGSMQGRRIRLLTSRRCSSLPTQNLGTIPCECKQKTIAAHTTQSFMSFLPIMCISMIIQYSSSVAT